MNTIAVTAADPQVSTPAPIVSLTTGDFRSARRMTKRGRTLADLMSYENPDVVARLAHEEGLSIEEARSLFRDTLLFLWLGSQMNGPLAPTPRIDLGWHVFLLFTQDYREFCCAYFGRFVDHHPRRLTDKPDGGQVVRKSRDHAENILVAELGFSLSRNWIYSALESDGKCCGNCGQDCCSR